MQRIKNMLIQLLTLIFVLLAGIGSAEAGTCSSISRANYSANQVLTSTQLNADFNTVYGAANALDGGCITDGTLEFAAVNSSEWAAVLNGVQRGCKVNYSSASAVTISNCYATVNGSQIAKSSSTTVSMGCGDCSSETASTDYYVYIKNGSTGSTITGFLSTSAPNDDGYDGSNNMVLGRLYNNGSSDIDQYSIDQWSVNRFIPTNTEWVDAGAITIAGGTSNPTKGTTNLDKIFWRRNGDSADIQIIYEQTSGGSDGSGDYIISIPTGLNIDSTKVGRAAGAVDQVRGLVVGGCMGGNTNLDATTTVDSGNVVIHSATQIRCLFDQGNLQNPWSGAIFQLSSATVNVSMYFSVPIEGWGN